MSWREIYNSKLVTAEQAIRNIKDGDRVVTSFGCSEPKGIIRSMCENYKDFHDVQVSVMIILGETPWVKPEYKGHFSLNCFFAGATNRDAISCGAADYTTCYFYEIPYVLREVVKPRVTMM